MSREGVQRDLLPLIEGTTVSTKYGPVKTDHVLFIASGAFHLAKPVRPVAGAAGPPADPRGAGAAVARRSAADPDRAGALAAEAVCGADGDRRGDAGVRRRCDRRAGRSGGGHQRPGREHRRPAAATVLEKLLEEISFTATDRGGETMTVDAAYVNDRVAPLARKGDLSRFIL